MAKRRKRPAAKGTGQRKPLRVKRPGALTARKRRGESTVAAARRLKKSGTPLEKRQAGLYLNVLRPANPKRPKGTKKTTARKRGRKR